MALFDSPFSSAMILSYDGGGNDGNFLLAEGSRATGIGVIGSPDASLNLGFSYEFFGTLMPEVYPWGKFRDGRWANSGTIMALAGLGRSRQSWLDSVHRIYASNSFMCVHTLRMIGTAIGITDTVI